MECKGVHISKFMRSSRYFWVEDEAARSGRHKRGAHGFIKAMSQTRCDGVEERVVSPIRTRESPITASTVAYIQAFFDKSIKIGADGIPFLICLVRPPSA